MSQNHDTKEKAPLSGAFRAVSELFGVEDELAYLCLRVKASAKAARTARKAGSGIATVCSRQR